MTEPGIENSHPQVGEAAPEVIVTNAGTQEPFALASLWSERPAVLVFLRHLGCMFCREYTAQLQEDLAAFQKYEAKIALINFETAEATHKFCDARSLVPSFVCLSDTERNAYRAYNLSRITAGELFAPHVWARGFQAALHGHLASIPKGDPFQMPGVFVVDTSGIIQFAHRNKDAADNPPNEMVLSVLRDLAPA